MEGKEIWRHFGVIEAEEIHDALEKLSMPQ
jgi:hypothetical protein